MFVDGGDVTVIYLAGMSGENCCRSGGNMLIAVIIFVVLLCIGIPVGMVIAISSLSYFFTADFKHL